MDTGHQDMVVRNMDADSSRHRSMGKIKSLIEIKECTMKY